MAMVMQQQQQQPEVLEVIEYIDDVDYDCSHPFEWEEIEESVEEIVVQWTNKSYTRVNPWEAGIGTPPPPFTMPQELKQRQRECRGDENILMEQQRQQQQQQQQRDNDHTATDSATAGKPRRESSTQLKAPGVTQRRKTEIVDQALIDTGNVIVMKADADADPEEYEYEEYEEEEIIEEEYYGECMSDCKNKWLVGCIQKFSTLLLYH